MATDFKILIALFGHCSEPDVAPVGVHPGPSARPQDQPDADSLGEQTRGRLPRHPVQGSCAHVGRAQTEPGYDVREVQQIHEVSGQLNNTEKLIESPKNPL